MKINIKGTLFEAPDRYAEGHTVNANEAAVLNQTLMENIGNNFRDTVADWKGTPEELQAAFATKLAGYSFGVRSARGPSTASDPIGAEALRLAVAFLKSKIAAAGKKLKDYTSGQINESARKLLEKNDELANSFRTQAQQNVEAIAARSENGSADLDELIASLPPSAPAGETEAQPEAEVAPAPADTPQMAPEGETSGRRRNRG